VFGDVLIACGDRVVGSLTEAMREIAILKGLELGELSLVAGPYAADIAVDAAVAEMAARHPGLLVQLAVKDWTGVYRAVADGSADLGIGDVSQALSQPDLDVEPLRHARLTFFCRAGHPILDHPAPGLADVLAYPWVGPMVPMPADSRLQLDEAPFGVIDPVRNRLRPRILVETFAAAKVIVARGDAISAALPIQIAREVADGVLSLVPADLSWPNLNYGIIRRKGRSLSPAAERFRDILRGIEARIDDLAATMAA